MALAAASPAAAATEVVITGKGWGHGVGMSQWGAYGYARHGWSYQRILAHYYPGTTLATASQQRIRVQLATGVPSVSIACPGGIRVSDRTGRGYALPAGEYSFASGLRLPVGHERVRVRNGANHRERFAVQPVERPLRSPLVFDCPSAPLMWNGRSYHGLLVVRRDGTRLSIVNSVTLDDYVQGVVGGEMPHNWNLAALEAQAVAARSYALATLHPNAHFDLYSDARSQVYGGIAYETPGIDFAVRRTAGKILEWHGHVATTYFFSTSGGRTASVQDVWPKLGAVPYLQSVSDPYDASSPHHAWGPYTFDAARLAATLGVAPGALHVAATASGRVADVRIGSATISGAEFMAKLGLQSTWFQIGELSLAAARPRVLYGAKVSLGAHALGVGSALLQRRVGAGRWKTLAHVSGARSVAVEPQGQTQYRLSAAGVTGPVVSVAVAPHLRVAPAGRDLLTGDVAPVSRGAVTVWRRRGSGWLVVAHPQIDAAGHFSTQLKLHPGGYRISVGETARFASATASVAVTPRLLASFAR